MEGFKEGYEAAHTKIAGYDEGNGNYRLTYEGNARDVFEMALCIAAGATVATCDREQTLQLAAEMAERFLEKCEDAKTY